MEFLNREEKYMKTNNKFYRISFTLYVVVLLVIAHLSCNPGVPGNGSSGLAFLNNIRKMIGVTSATPSENATISVRGTIKDGSGSGISGATLDIGSGTRAVVDTKVFTNSTGEFSVNLKVGNFSVRVTSSTGISLGSFDLSVTGTSTPPTISNGTGSISVSNLSANPVGLTPSSTPTAPVISISNTPSSIAEGSSATIGIKLSGTVTKEYTVSLTSSVISSLVVTPTTLRFNPSNYSIDQAVTLSGVQDENLVSETVSISLNSEGLTPVDFKINVMDDDLQNILITGTNTLVEGTSGNINVSLSKQPDSDVTVNLYSDNISSLTLGTSILTFTPNNYNNPQTVVINAIQDTNNDSENLSIFAYSSLAG